MESESAWRHCFVWWKLGLSEDIAFMVIESGGCLKTVLYGDGKWGCLKIVLYGDGRWGCLKTVLCGDGRWGCLETMLYGNRKWVWLKTIFYGDGRWGCLGLKTALHGGAAWRQCFTVGLPEDSELISTIPGTSLYSWLRSCSSHDRILATRVRHCVQQIRYAHIKITVVCQAADT